MYKKFYFKLSKYFNDKLFWNEEEQEFVDFDKATVYNGYLQYRDIDGPKLISEPELNRHDMCNLVPVKVDKLTYFGDNVQ